MSLEEKVNREKIKKEQYNMLKKKWEKWEKISAWLLILSLRTTFYYLIALKSTLRNLFAHYSSEISDKFPSFLLLIAATLQRPTVHELLMRLHIDVRETLKRNVYFWKRLLCRAMRACRILHNGILKCESPHSTS